MTKKYIIDGAFLARLYQLIEMECPNDDLRDELAALKPVEPMSDEQIKEIHSQSVVSAGTMWARPVTFARAIEQRIVGELK